MADHQFKGLILAAAVCLAACDPAAGPSAPGADPVPDQTIDISAWQQAEARATVVAVSAMVNASREYLREPDDETRIAWQQHWIAAHEHYLAASLLRSKTEVTQAAVDSWPIHPGFVDSLPDYPESGIVMDTILPMTSDMVRQQHQITDDEEIASGFHVIEYYAFERPAADFSESSSDAQRRARFVNIVSDLLMLDLLQFEQALQAGSPDTGVTLASELLARLKDRTKQILAEYQQTGEHCPFSGRSAQAVLVQLSAVRDILNAPLGPGRYLMDQDPGLAQTFRETLDEAISLIPPQGSIQEENSARLLLLIAALSHQAEDLAGTSY